MTPETPKQRLASLLLGTPVAPWIRERRESSTPWRLIAAELRDATKGEIDVPIQTVINWAERAEPAEPAAQAS